MHEFFQACLAFPTVVFSLFLGVALIYWLFVFAGALDLEMLDLGGDAGGELDLGGDVEMDVDADADASGDGGDADGASRGVFADLLYRLDLTEVPLTVSLSLFLLLAWTLCFVAVQTIGPIATTLVWGASVGTASALVSLALTSRFALLLRPMFRTHYAPLRRSLVGQVCEITTLRVDDRYGQAEVADGGAGLLIQVRSSNAERLGRGSRALIFDYDSSREIFQVKPLDDAAPELAH